MFTKTIVTITALTVSLSLIACSDTSPTQEGGSTTDPGGSETGDGDGDGDGDGTGETEPICGDGAVDPGEQCDDANRVGGDGCEADCTLVACSLAWNVVDPETTISGSSFGRPSIVVREDGTIVTVHEGNGDPGIDVRARAWTPEGELVWEVAHSFDTLRDRPFDMVADADGDLYVAASINATNDGRANVFKLSGADGSLIWQWERDGLVGGALDRAVKLDFDGSGRLLAALEINDDEAGADVVLIAFDPTSGAEQWTTTWTAAPGIHGESNDAVGALLVDPGGDILLIANRDAGPGAREPVFLRFEPDASSPKIELDMFIDGELDYDSGVDLEYTESGELVALIQDQIEIQGADGYHFMLAGLDAATGATLWHRPSTQYGLGDDVFGEDIEPLAGGGFVLAGWGDEITADDQQGFVLRLGPDFSAECLGLLDRSVQTELEGIPLLLGVAATDAGRAYVSGLTFDGQFRTLVAAWD